MTACFKVIPFVSHYVIIAKEQTGRSLSNTYWKSFEPSFHSVIVENLSVISIRHFGQGLHVPIITLYQSNSV